MFIVRNKQTENKSQLNDRKSRSGSKLATITRKFLKIFSVRSENPQNFLPTRFAGL